MSLKVEMCQNHLSSFIQPLKRENGEFVTGGLQRTGSISMCSLEKEVVDGLFGSGIFAILGKRDDVKCVHRGSFSPTVETVVGSKVVKE